MGTIQYIPSLDELDKQTYKSSALESARSSTPATLSGRTEAYAGGIETDSQIQQTLADDFSKFCLISNFTNVDSNGFLSDLSVVFTISGLESSVASAMEELTSGQMTIINEIIAYTYNSFDEGNELITSFYNGYNGLSDPSITKESGTFFGMLDYYVYTTALDANEADGLKEKFGFQVQNASQMIDSSVSAAAGEVFNSYQSKRMVLKRAPNRKINPRHYATTYRPPTDEDTTAPTPTPTTTAGGGY